MYTPKTNRAVYWAIRAFHWGAMRVLSDAVENSVGWKVEAYVEEAVTWAAGRTVRIALEGAVEDPDHSALQEFLCEVEG